jgi:hypothetical protein
MLSLKAVYRVEEIRQFDKACRARLGGKVEYVGEPKYDGLSVELVYLDGKRRSTRLRQSMRKNSSGCSAEMIHPEALYIEIFA